MNEIKKEYGFLTAITPKEIDALGKPQEGDEYFNEQWISSKYLGVDGYWANGNPVRRPIDPGEGWELVPKEEVGAKCGTKQPTWQYEYFGKWKQSDTVSYQVYRRPKSKPEQYGWLKPDCGVEMPFETPINARLKNGEMRIVMRRITGEVVFFSSHLPIPAPVAYWHRTGPAPEADKFDPCEEAYRSYVANSTSPAWRDPVDFKQGWTACCAHYHVGDQSK